MQRCKLDQVPRDLGLRHPRLTQLYLSGNSLVDLPPEMGRLSSLTHLDLSANPFPKVPQVRLYPNQPP